VNVRYRSENLKKLVAADLIILAVVALAFFFIIRSFDQIRGFIEKDIGNNVRTIVSNAELSRSIVSLEIDINSMLAASIRNPEELKVRIRTITDAFYETNQKFVEGRTHAYDKFALGSYHDSFDKLLKTLKDMSGNVMKLSNLGDVFTEYLNAMENNAGKLMVDYALDGKSIAGLQQVYALIPFCKERIAKARILIETGVMQNNSFILGIGDSEENGRHETVSATMFQLTQTLKTLTSSDKAISSDAIEVLAELPRYMAIVRGLDVQLKSFKAELDVFNESRSAIISALSSIDLETSGTINTMKMDIHDRMETTSAIIYMISGIVIFVSFIGWIFIRKIGLQMESTASDAMLAKKELQKSNDDLEQRVYERTADIQKANEQLQAEIFERKNMENQIRSSLEEKEVLLQEIHHRVKNNMTVIHSLLYMQATKVKDEHYRVLLSESMNRIKTMALIHERLYQSENLNEINFNDYLRDIVKNITSSHWIESGKVAVEMDIQDASLGVDDAIPCGLIVNELVTNALEHAFPEGRDGKIRLTLQIKDQDEVELTVADNGIGMPEDLDSRKADSLGLTLVDSLVRQLRGNIILKTEEGAGFLITFKRRN